MEVTPNIKNIKFFLIKQEKIMYNFVDCGYKYVKHLLQNIVV